ncbi:MAG: response regulator [Lachnospiraceae bacterium]|nr:response regulator [Lachnospiraceae bacterium]
MLSPFKSKTTENGKLEDVIKKVLLDNVVEGLIVADESGDILYSNSLGQAIMDEGLFGPIDIVSKNPKTFIFNAREYKAIYDGIPEGVGVTGTVTTLIDTMGLKEQAKELSEIKEKLQKASGFKAAFLANMSHEIRTPIHAIIGFAEIIMKEPVDEKVKTQIEMIKDSSYSLLAIINDVLDLSKIESGKMELVNSNYYISYIIRDIEATYSLLASRKGLGFKMHLDDNIPSNLYGDKIRLRGTLLNILNNAVKYTREGHIDFYVKVLEKKDGIATLCFEVKDTGIGIRKEDLDKVFDSFSRFDIQNNYSVEGRGLGLSIAKGYMDLMGGRIEVDSEYGVGSIFRVIVDQKIVDDSPIDMDIVNARKKKKGEGFAIKGMKALVVDDNPVNLTVADGLMKTYGLIVDKASGGKEAVALCLTNQYDIVFMDQMMPEMDGIQAMKEIRKINAYYNESCTIIVLTADAMAGARDKLMSEGFDEYLSKPLEMHRLEAMLLKFVPEDKIVDIDNLNNEEIIIEESEGTKDTSKTEKEKPDNRIDTIAKGLGIDAETLEKRIKGSGGTLEDYRVVCEIACKHAEAKAKKLRDAKNSGDYDRYTIEVHALKSTFASLGATELSARAKEQEMAGKEGRFELIDEKMESLVNDYLEFMAKVKEVVLDIDVSEQKAKASGKGEEWTDEELSQIANKLLSLIDEFRFGDIFDILENITKIEKGPETKAIFDRLEALMNRMDIDGLKKELIKLAEKK